MDLSIINRSAKLLNRTLTKNSPTILTALGVAGLITTVVMAVKATPRALEILDMEDRFREEEWQNNRDSGEPRTLVDTIELTWKCYIPTAIMGATTIACIIGANHINLRRNAALASLFSITETTLREYQAKVVEQIGEKKEEKIRGEIAQDKLNTDPVNEKAIIITGKGESLCYDSFSGRYFKIDIQTLRKIENDFNKRLLNDMWLPINILYYEMGLESITMGEDMGWKVERGMLEFKFSSKLTKESSEPCVVIDYTVSPNHI